MKKFALICLLVGLALMPVSAGNGSGTFMTKQADINIASSGDNTVITPNADQRVIIWKMWIVGNGAVNLTFKDGSTALNGSAIHLTADGSSMTFPFDGEPYWFTSTAGNAFKINLSGAVQVNGRIYYTLVNP
jgi:hypothetical protein